MFCFKHYFSLKLNSLQLLFQVFKRHGLAKVDPLGEKFNPNHHEALFEQVDAYYLSSDKLLFFT